MKNYIRLNLGITKVYLLPCKGGYLLIDTGYKDDYKKFRKKLVKNGIQINQIKYLLLTHYHDDHSGFAAKLKSEYGIPLIVQKSSIRLLAKGDSGTEDEGYYITKRLRLLFYIFELFHKNFHYPPVIVDSNDIIVNGSDNQTLRTIGINAGILFTPGHSVDSMSVLCDDGTAFAGDAAMNFLKFTGTHYRPIYYANLKQTYASIKSLITEGAKTIVPAHGNEYPVNKLKQMLKHFHVC